MYETHAVFLISTIIIMSIKSSLSHITIKLTPTDLIGRANQLSNSLDEVPTAYERLFINVSSERIDSSVIKQLSFSAFGIMLNMSYTQLFLRLSFDYSLIYIQSLKHVFNSSELKSNLYTSSDENCWLKSTKSDFCYSESVFSLNNENYPGYLGHEFGFLGRHFFIYQSMVYIEKGSPVFKNEFTHGVLGLGFSDFEGSYGYMFIEQLLRSEVILKARVGICFNYFDSYMYLGNHEALNPQSNTTLFKLTNAFKLELITSELFVDNNKMNQEPILTHINIDEPYLFLPDSTIERIERQIVYYMCYRNRSEIVISLKDRVCKDIPNLFHGGVVDITLSQKSIFEEFLPEITIVIFDEIRLTKIEKKFKNYLRICPGFKNWTEIEINSQSNDTYYNICSLLRRKKGKYEIELGVLFFEGNIVSLNYERGILGITPVHKCPSDFSEVIERNFPLGLEILYNIVCLMIVSAIIIFSVSKCDTYFHDDYEIIIEEEEENVEQEGEGNDPSRGD